MKNNDNNIQLQIFVLAGRGKTEATRNLNRRVLKAFKEHIDRDIRCLASLENYMSGYGKISPLSFSLLECLPEAGNAEYVENILDAFLVAMPGCAPLRPFLRKALQKLYKNHLDSAGVPVMKDLIASLNGWLKEK